MKGYEGTYDCSYGHLDHRYGYRHFGYSVRDSSEQRRREIRAIKKATARQDELPF